MTQDKKALIGPTQLACSEVFEGREGEVNQLISELAPSSIYTLWGAPGIGKTALAAEVIQRLSGDGEQTPENFPDGVFIHSFHDDPTIDRACEAISAFFGGDPRFPARIAAERALAGKQALLVLDGTEQVSDLDALLDMRGSCGVIVTTHTQPEKTGNIMELKGLEDLPGLFAFQKYAGGGFHDPEASKAVVEILEGCPLAIRIAGLYTKESGESVEGTRSWLESSDAGTLDVKLSMLLERSIGKLGDNGRKVIAAAGNFSMQPFDRIMIAAVLKLDEIETRNAISPVVRYGLFDYADGQYTISHPLVRQFSANRMVDFLPEDAIERLGVFFAEFADFAAQKGLDGYGHIDEIRIHAMTALEKLVEGESWETANRLCWAMHDYLDIKGYSSDRLRVCEIGVAASRGSDHQRNEGVWLGSTGNAYYAAGQIKEAIDHYKQALEIAVKSGDRRNEGTWLGNLGSAYLNAGQFNRAIDLHEKALVIAQETGDHRGEGNHLGILGNAHAALGKLPEAIEYFKQAISAARESGDKHHEANWLRSAGDIHRNLGQADEAINCFEQSQDISRQLGDLRGEGLDLGSLGIAYANLGRLKKAIARFEQALEIAQAIGDRTSEGSTYGNLGNAFADLGQVDEAIKHHNQALAISRELGNKQGEGNDLGNLGIVYKQAGNIEKARQSWEQALEIFEGLKSSNADILRTWLSDLE